MSLKTYDVAAVIVTFGEITLQGFANGTSVTSDRDEDAFTKDTGNDGETTRSRSNNRGGSITVTLKQSSTTNDLLSAIAAEDDLFGTGVRPMQIEDLNGTTLEHAQNAWIKKTPQAAYAKESGDREWTFDVDRLDRNIGGNF